MPSEETSGTDEGAQQQNTGTNAGTPPPPASSTAHRVINHMSGNKIEAALWVTRIATVVFTFMFFLPIFGNNPPTSFQRALLSNAATSALRLHQRLPNFQLSREFFGRLFLEDSAHYLFYSLIFVSAYPITLVLIPIVLFALLHAQKYTQQILNVIGPSSLQTMRNLLAKLDNNQVNILRFIACGEIFLMPVIIVMIFTGNSSLLLPFIYYRFLTLRYGSRRNPYCRQLFFELKVATEQLVARPQCPGIIRNFSFQIMNMISRLAPAVQAQ